MEVANTISQLCLKKFDDLPKNGKPEEGKQWTALAGFVKQCGDDYEVVAIGTGTTCLGESQMRKDGLILHDNHAEVIARRSFIRYLYHEILSTWQSTKTSTIFNKTNDGKCCLKSGGSFHFYTSNTPCGDATIFPISQPLNQTQSKGVKRKCEQVKLNPEKKVCIHETADEIEQATTQTQSDINRRKVCCW
uniref:tRNA-specific adenosine deaminase 1-like isoform X4 n=1 Tax=Ciona intestinalis TaxID=7719 RepID=UPI000EF4BBCD|nr:tRNA-specific adenosine deaminase 1-like isoform X4 [Ciona intestinalis]|eukprot:XP_026693020.1 tRNA-specific adenosine deaminase 1-like isoform X4 [Ciona intestinalis]